MIDYLKKNYARLIAYMLAGFVAVLAFMVIFFDAVFDSSLSAMILLTVSFLIIAVQSYRTEALSFFNLYIQEAESNIKSMRDQIQLIKWNDELEEENEKLQEKIRQLESKRPE